MDPQKQFTGLKLPQDGDPLSVILKVVGESCNLDCGYCYERRRSYHGRRLLRSETVRKFLDGLREHSLYVELHGGEPLLAPRSLLHDIFEALRRHPKPVRLRMQTNATLLSAEWIQFLTKEWPDIGLGVSLDGDAAANAWRYDRLGDSTHRAVSAALELLSDTELHVGVIAVVTRTSLGRAAEIVDHLAGYRCIRVVKFVPSFDVGVRQGAGPIRSKATLNLMAAAQGDTMVWATTPAEFSEYLIEAWQHWRQKHYHERFLLEPHVTFLRAIQNQPVADCHFSPRKCSFVLTLYPDGRVGTCDEIDRSKVEIGHVPLASGENSRFWRESELAVGVATLLQKCRSCSHREACGGGCVASRLRLEAQGWGDAYCEHRKTVIDYLASELAAMA